MAVFTSCAGLIKASNGDILAFTNTALSGDGTKYFVWRYSPTTAHEADGGWDGIPCTYPGSANTFDAVAFCESITTADTFYLYGVYDTPTITAKHVGLTLTYDVNNRTATASNGTTEIGGPTTASPNAQTDQVRGAWKSLYMFHDGTNVHILHRTASRNTSRYLDGDTWYYEGYTNYTAKLYGWTGSTWGTASVVATKDICTYWSVDDYWRPAVGRAGFLGKTANGNLFVANANLSTINSPPAVLIYELSLSGSSYSTVYSGSLAGAEHDFYINPEGKIIALSLSADKTIDRREYTTSFGPAASYTLPHNPYYGFSVYRYKTDNGPLREAIVSPATSYSYVYYWGTYTSISYGLFVQTINQYNGSVRLANSTPLSSDTIVPFMEFLRTANGSFAIPSTSIADVVYYTYAYYYTSYGLGIYFYPIELNEVPSCTAISPINGIESFDQTSDEIEFTWKYNDFGDDTQTAFELKLSENVPSSTVYYLDGSGGMSASQTTVPKADKSCTLLPGVLNSSNYGYQWSVRVRDGDLAWSSFTPWNTFKVSGKPVAQITYPSDSLFGNYPHVEWNYTDPEEHSQSAYRLRLYDADMNTLWVGEEVQTIGLIAHGGTGTGQVEYECNNGERYTIGLVVMDSSGTSSNEARRSFTCRYEGGQTPTWTLTQNSNSTVNVEFAVSGYINSELYRWSERLAKYVLLSEFNGASFTYLDYSAPINGVFTYMVKAFREDSVDTYTSVDVATQGDDWFVCTQNYILECAVTDIGYDIEKAQQQTLEPLGRSKQVIGVPQSPFGGKGSFTIRLVPEERDRAYYLLHKMAEEPLTAYIKSPWGDVFGALIGAPEETWRVGGMVDFVVDFVEIEDS